MGQIALFGWQAGPDGFVRYGTSDSADLDKWTDYLYLLCCGGRGSGKSTAGAARTLLYMGSWPGCLGIAVAPTVPMLHDSLLPTLFRIFDQAGMVRGRDYIYAMQREEVELPNGSRLLLRSTEHPERLRGQDAAFAWHDEPRDSPVEAFLNLQATLRQQGYPHQAWFTTTPVGKRHWTYKYFGPAAAIGAPGGDEAPPSTYRTYFARTRDNPHGGEEHYQQLVQTYGENSPRARQELFGEFVVLEGLVYEAWNPSLHVVDPNDWPDYPTSRVAAGIDFGFASPSAVVVGGLDSAGRHYIIDEFYRAGLSERDLVVVCRELRSAYGIRCFFADSSDPRWLSTLRRGGLTVYRANKRLGLRDPSLGIGLVDWAMRRSDLDGNQLWYVSPACQSLISELDNYVWEIPRNDRNPSEHPIKRDDHACDSLRYLYNGFSRLGWLEDKPARLQMLKSTLVTG